MTQPAETRHLSEDWGRMHFGFPEEQGQWREPVRDFVRPECPPKYARPCGRHGRPPEVAAQG